LLARLTRRQIEGLVVGLIGVEEELEFALAFFLEEEL
jgi:hypothetical protein